MAERVPHKSLRAGSIPAIPTMIDQESVKQLHWSELKSRYRRLCEDIRIPLVGSDRNDQTNHELTLRAHRIYKQELLRRGYQPDDL